MIDQCELMYIIGDSKPYYENSKNEVLIDLLDLLYTLKRQSKDTTNLTEELKPTHNN